ncbi:MAG: HD domain-containing protein [Candidatus Micrarchaeia archaeon]
MARFHHYKGGSLSRSEKVERKAIRLLLDSKVPDSERESSVVWELKHTSGCIQIARILAQKRGLDLEIAETAAALHDISVIQTGKYKDHGILGAKIAEKTLDETGGFSEKEKKTIADAVRHHSEKDVVDSGNPYVELIKDADAFDCSLYSGAEEEYKQSKPAPVFEKYVQRIRRVRKELGLDEKDVFRK